MPRADKMKVERRIYDWPEVTVEAWIENGRIVRAEVIEGSYETGENWPKDE